MNQEFKKFLSKQGLSRLQKGHPWVLRRDLKETYKIPKDCRLAHLGEHWFAVSQAGNIALRRIGPANRNWAFSWEGIHHAPDFFITPENSNCPEIDLFWKKIEAHVGQLWDLKRSFYPKNSCFRWLFSENDCFPGLILDVFSQTFVAQIQSPFVDHFWPQIQQILEKCIYQKSGANPVKWVLLRNHMFRAEEGLPVVRDSQEPEIAHPPQVESWQGLKWKFHPGVGQKTGGYLDQGENHLICSTWAARLNLKNCWDLFCHHGGFGVQLLQLPSAKVLFVDSSEPALTQTVENIKLNGFTPDRYQISKADVFEFLRQDMNTGKPVLEQPDLIVLDPPGFAKKKGEKDSALRAFRDLNLRSMKFIQSGGMLVSCSCSQPISHEDFLIMLQESAHAARKSIQVLQIHGPSYDHPVKVEFPEGNYLQAWFLRVI